MHALATALRRTRNVLTTHPRRAWALAAGFLTVHGILIREALHHYIISADAGLYRLWVTDPTTIFGLNQPWVYPVGANLPMRLGAHFANTLEGSFAGRADTLGWVLAVTLINAAVITIALTIPRTDRAPIYRGTWTWLLLALVYGHLSLTRIDAPANALAFLSLAFLAAAHMSTRHKPAYLTIAVISATLGAAVKVWPAAIVATLLLVGLPGIHRARLWVLAAGAGTVTTITGLGLYLGGTPANMLSFLDTQSGRALQFEAPLATVTTLLAHAHIPGYHLYFNKILYTVDSVSPASTLIAALSTPLQLLTLALITALAYKATKRKANWAQLAPWTLIAITTTLITLNKVGSPQYITWLITAAAFFPLLGTHIPRHYFGALLGLLLITHIWFPIAFKNFLTQTPHAPLIPTAVYLAHSALAFAVLFISIKQLHAIAEPPHTASEDS